MSAGAASLARTALILTSIALAAGGVWIGLTDLDMGALWIGAPTVALTTVAAARAGLPAMAPRLGALPAFALLFLAELASSAAALALRLVRRDPGFAPGLLAHRLRLRGEGARAAFMNAVSLTPGSLSVSLDGDELIVHSLDGDREAVRAALADLEARVARLYAETS